MQNLAEIMESIRINARKIERERNKREAKNPTNIDAKAYREKTQEDYDNDYERNVLEGYYEQEAVPVVTLEDEIGAIR